MLGKQVEVDVDCPAAEEKQRVDEGKTGRIVCSGRIRTLAGHKPAYYIGLNSVSKNAFGTVIAIADKGVNERFVVAPRDCVYYEPQIRSAIADIGAASPGKLLCLYEKSCGAVVFRIESGEPHFLLVKNRNGAHWGFPKGHIEEGEGEQQTAVREVLEETGLHITILDGFRETSQYRPFGKVKKQVVFFVAQSEKDDVIIQRAEIDRFQWVTFGGAMKLFRYENDSRVLKLAMKWLTENMQAAF